MPPDLTPAARRDWKVIGCTCDFSGGTRGMDRCHHCGGTGSRLFHKSGDTFPNTETGWKAMMEKKRGKQLD